MNAEREFLEEYTFGDAQKALGMLTPGSEDYYFFHGLYYFKTGDTKAYNTIMEEYRKRYEYDEKRHILTNRELLASYVKKPRKVLEKLIDDFGITLSHARISLGRAETTAHPDILDDKALRTEALIKKYRHNDIRSRLTPEGKKILFAMESGKEREALVRDGEITDPFVKGVLDTMLAILADPDREYSFARIPVHNQLCLAQMDYLAHKRGQLMMDENFIQEYFRRLRAEENPTPGEQEAELKRLREFAAGLPDKFNSVKACLCLEQLGRNQREEVYDKKLFMEYLNYPRVSSVTPRTFIEDVDDEHRATIGIDTSYYTGIPAAGDDRDVLAAHLTHFFREEDSYQPYLPYLTESFLRDVFGSARILHGDARPEYFNMIPSGRREELTRRVEITVRGTTPRVYAADDDVRLDMAFKNVERVFVKVYCLNAANYMRKTGQAPAENFDVYGIAPNHERTLEFDYPATRRFEQKLEFPELKAPGQYIIDIISKGAFARAVIRKGGFHLTSHLTDKGVKLRVFDLDRQPVKGAHLYIQSHAYTTQADGTMLVPYSSHAGQQTVVISKDGVASLGTFYHPPADYRLEAGIFLEKESVVPGNTARVLINPRLTCAGFRARLELLKNVVLRLKVQARDGIETSNTARDITLKENEDFVYGFRVPDFAQTVSVTLEGEVELPWENDPVKLEVSEWFAINPGTEPVRVEDVYLVCTEKEYILQVRGKNGEPISGFSVQACIRNRYFNQDEVCDLQSSRGGVIRLGRLEDIAAAAFSNGRTGLTRTFNLRAPRPYLPAHLVFPEEDLIRIPLQMTADFTPGAETAIDDLYLIRTIRGVPLEDCRRALQPEEGLLVLKGLAAGEYRLYSPLAGINTLVSIRRAARLDDSIVSEKAAACMPELSGLRISGMEVKGGRVRIRVAGGTADTRVHAVMRGFLDTDILFPGCAALLEHPLDESPLARTRNGYVSDKPLDLEYMYILHRADDPAYVGNLLERPGLILNRIETRTVDTIVEPPPPAEAFAEDLLSSALGESPRAARLAAPKRAAKSRERAEDSGGTGMDGTEEPAWYDFIREPAAVFFNLVPDAKGEVVIPLEHAGDLRLLSVCAVDGTHAAGGRLCLPGPAAFESLDLKLQDTLDPEKILVQRSRARGFALEQKLEIANRASSDYVVYRSVRELMRYLQALHDNPLLREFDFIAGWAGLSIEEKQEKYSRYACHEFNFFISRKDPDFFANIVRPYLAHKMHKTFLDLYLLEEDLGDYADEAARTRLNLFERILLDRRRGIDAFFVNDLFEPDPAAEERAIEAALGVFGLEEAGDAIAESRTAALGRGMAMKKVQALMASMGAEADMKMLMDGPPMEMEKDCSDGESRKEEAEEPQEFFRNVDKTKEYMENNYYGRPPSEQDAWMIPANRFWADWAAHVGGPFLSANIGTISGGFTELVLVLALTELPFEAPEHDVNTEGPGAVISFNDNALVYLREVLPLEEADADEALTVKSRYFYGVDLDKDEEDRKDIREEFLPGTVYFHDVTIVNPSDRYRECDLLVQIPQGSLAFNVKGDIVRRKIELSPYNIHNERVFFYFPSVGSFRQYPVRLYDRNGLLGSGETVSFDVKQELTRFDEQSWEFIADTGDHDRIMNFLKEADLKKVDLSRVYYLLDDADFHKRLSAWLEGRHHVDEEVNGYAFKHDYLPGLRAYLKSRNPEGGVGCYYTSALLNIDAVREARYQHLEYDPLVIPRAHSLEGRAGIEVPVLEQQYGEFLRTYAHKDAADDEDRLQFVYYLMLQNRRDEALAQFDRIDRGGINEKIQYDYMACYAAFLREDGAAARKAAESYTGHPVPKWRKLFKEVLTQLDEAEGTRRKDAEESRESRLAQLADREAVLELAEKDGRIICRGRNIGSIEAKLYLIDAETLFSSNPFDQGLSDRFSYVVPAWSAAPVTDPAGFEQDLDIPGEFRSRDLYVEIAAAGIVRSRLIFACDLKVEVFENYGRLKVCRQADNASLKKVYAKVYARTHSGEAVFYKDGYTDMRGVFDYASLSSDLIDRVAEYAILVLSPEHGSQIVKAGVPKR